MPPPSSWSSRLLSAGSASSSARDKPLPRPPPSDYLDPPTLNHDRRAPSPTRPRPAGSRQHTHNRSASNPLPKIFGRKKSTNFHDTDVPLDDGLVPVSEHSEPAPSRVISGKRGKAFDEGNKTTRKCMCCDSRVNVPRELPRFRCLCCLTINDLKPIEEQTEDDQGRPIPKHAETYSGKFPSRGRLPLSTERTRVIIDHCLDVYLEERCRQQESGVSAFQTGKEDVFAPEARPVTLPTRSTRDDDAAKNALIASIPASETQAQASPHGTSGLSTSATIREFADFDQFAGTRLETPPPLQHPIDMPSPTRRKPVPIPTKPTRRPPPPPMGASTRRPSHHGNATNGNLAPDASHPPRLAASPRQTMEGREHGRHHDRAKNIFRPLEDYIVANFGDFHCLNASFSTLRPAVTSRARSESNIVTPPPEPTEDFHPSPMEGLSGLDAKTLLIGDIGENGSWWTGKIDRNRSDMKRKKVGEAPKKTVSSKTSNINWEDLASWYDLVHTAGEDWQKDLETLKLQRYGLSTANVEGVVNIEEIRDELADAREHAVRTLLKVTENLLKRPSRPIKEPGDLRFLLILLANPSLYPSANYQKSGRSGDSQSKTYSGKSNGSVRESPKKSPGRDGSQHNGLLKRIFGLLAHSPDTCHRYLVGWFTRFEEQQFVRTVDLVASFVTHRIARRSGRPRRKSAVNDGGLIPDLSGSTMNTSAQLHSAMGLSGSVKKSANDPNEEPDWVGDWQIKAAAKMMSLLFAANNVWQGKRRDTEPSSLITGQGKARRNGQLLHTSSFYNTLLDYHDLIADFRVWETRRDKFAFCQYPLFLSMGAKIKILEHDARRQMEIKAREAYFDQVIRQRAIDGHFTLRIRRECMVDDSLRQISAAVGAGQEELKKGLRVQFTGEEGVDAGGPRKEWFLMLVKDIFQPDHGMFSYDDESNTCYFNPNSFETSDQYYLVGALLGLAIYNSTILDVALPPFAFRKLLAAAPASATNATNVSTITGTKGQMTYDLADLAEFRPSLAAGLQQLLDFDGDVESTYCRDFVAPVERYGTITNVPLKPNGEKIPVTNANRHEFVDAYVRYLLDGAVARQFEPFKRGFFTVCAGNALSLFRAEEIELLVRGSDEALDVDSLRAVAVYENWRSTLR